MTVLPTFKRLTCASLAATLFAGCAATVAPKPPAGLDALRRGPGNAPQKNVTDFSAALRCMDDTLYAYGTRDVVVLVEEMFDQTRRIGAGTRDMLVSAVSDMTRRSRAIRLTTFGQDNQNVTFLLQQLEKRTPFGVLPQYDIRGSISQLDEEVVRKDASLGANFQSLFGFTAGRSTQYNVLGFDASVISVPELTLVPGVTSKNTVVVARDERSVDNGVATISKTGLTFNMRVSRNAGVTQALRNMVELAGVELIGKLTRVPYWKCVGLPSDHPEVRREIEDWYHSMRDDGERLRFYQEQLRFRRFFDGPLDGKPSAALDRAMSAYRVGLGLPAAAVDDLAFFTAFLDRPVPAAPKQPFAVPAEARAPAAAATAAPATTALATTAPAAAGPSADAASSPAAAAAAVPRAAGQPPVRPAGPGQLTLATLQSSYRLGEEIELAIQSDRTAYLYCYVQAGDGAPIQRIYPNRNVKDPRIEADQAIVLPGGRGFRLVAEKVGIQKFACLTAAREVYNDLPPPLRWGDFEDVRLPSFAAIRSAFEKAAGTPVGLDEIAVDVRR